VEKDTEEMSQDIETGREAEQDHQKEIGQVSKNPKTKRERSLEDGKNFFWIKVDGQKKLATENLVVGNQVYNEKLVSKKDIEYRLWDPFRSKLAAAILNGLEIFPFKDKSSVLYLGVSTGTTVSHISDIVGPGGIIFGVEHASRVARDFLDRVASHRKNIVPIIQDARQPQQYFSVFCKVDVVYVDIAQPDQTDIAIANCKMFLKDGGYIFLVIKTRSIDVTKAPRRIIEEEKNKLRDNFEIIQEIDLSPYDKDHAMIIAKYFEKK
jgi:fibrillarin-like pre-rRNA processing protein